MMISNPWKNHLLGAVIFALLSTVLIVSWFRYGLLYGGGDVGIPSYDPSRILDIAKYVWWGDAAPGALVPHGVTSLPVQFFQSILANFGLPYFAVQAVLFWILLFLTGYGMFLLARSVFGKDKFFASILCGLFYMFNPYMMIQVWHRFIHNSFFLAAFLPFFYLFWDDWIKRGKFASILLFLFANILGVYLYGTIAYVVTVVFVLSFIFLKQTFLPWQGVNFLKKTALRFTAGLIFWTLVHAWWILPTFSITPALFSVQHKTSDSISTLMTLSRQTGIPYILSGINPFYVFEQADFGQIYKHPFFLAILWIPLLFLIPGFILSIKSKSFSSWGILGIAAVILAKGAAAPLGFIYIFAITQFFVLGVLRNPYEKMGMLLPFSFAIIYTLGVQWYLLRFKGQGFKLVKIFLVILLFLQLVVFLWPLWTGKLIGKFDKPALVDVPKYYGETDNFIKNQKKTGKILHLPLPQGESAAYNWERPFSGIESSQLLFSSLPSISRGQNIKHIDDIVNAASNIFRENGQDEKIISILRNLNVRFIVLHRDIIWQGGLLDDPRKLEGILDNKNFLEKRTEIGELVVYELAQDYFMPQIYTTGDVNLLSGGEKNSFWPYLLPQNNADLISAIDLEKPHNFSQAIVIPAVKIMFRQQNIPLEKAIAELPAASKILPGTNLYFLINLREKAGILVSYGSGRLKMKLNFLGKRLVEAVRLKEQGRSSEVSIDAYRKLLSEMRFTDKSENLIDLFAKHQVILESLLKNATSSEIEKIKQAENELLSLLRERELIPRYNIEAGSDIADLEYSAYHFQIPAAGEYELLMAGAGVRDVYQDKLNKLEFQIDGDVKELYGNEADGFMSYGKLQLLEGSREVILAATPSANLVNPHDFEIKPLTSDTWYTVTFEAQTKPGSKFRLQLIQDGLVDFDKTYTGNGNNGWNRYREGILLTKPAASHAEIRFITDEAPDAVFRNIKVERLLNNPIFLRSQNTLLTPTAPTSPVEFIRHSPVYYSGKIKLDDKGFIIFSESFHKDWRLKLFNSKGSFVPERRFLANMYANAWFVPNSGEYSFELEFTPQRIFYTGLLISITSFLSLSGFYLIKTRKWSKK